MTDEEFNAAIKARASDWWNRFVFPLLEEFEEAIAAAVQADIADGVQIGDDVPCRVMVVHNSMDSVIRNIILGMFTSANAEGEPTTDYNMALGLTLGIIEGIHRWQQGEGIDHTVVSGPVAGMSPQ